MKCKLLSYIGVILNNLGLKSYQISGSIFLRV